MSEQNDPIQNEPEKKENEAPKSTVDSVTGFVNNTQDSTSEFDPQDIEKTKTIAALSYIIFFLPLLTNPESKFGKFHANQSLVLLLTCIIGNLVLGIIPIIGWIIMPLFGIAVFILFVIGLLNGLNGKAKELPLIGKISLIK